MANQDYEIISLVRAAKKRNDPDYWIRVRGEESFNKILNLFENDFRNISVKWFINGADRQDVVQECRLGMINAIDDFDENIGMKFHSFSLMVIRRHLLTALSAANRKKFSVHNNAVSLDTPIITGDNYSEQTLADIMPDTNQSMLETMILQEEHGQMLQELLRRCTPLERRVLEAYSPDESYKEMAEHTNSKAKTIDNALMRIRKKADDIIRELDDKKHIEEIKQQKPHQTATIRPKAFALPENPPVLSPDEEARVVLLNATIKFEKLKKQYPDVSESDLLQFSNQIFTLVEQVLFVAYYDGDDLATIVGLYVDFCKNTQQKAENAR